MKKIILMLVCSFTILGLVACSSSSKEEQSSEKVEEASIEESDDSSEEVEESEQQNQEEVEETQIQHIDPSQYTVLMTYFASLTPEITHDEIIAFCEEQNLFHRREDYSSGDFELKIANDDEAAKIKYCRNPGENIFFKFNKDDTLKSAEYESGDNPPKEVLYYCGGGDVFGWKGLSTTNAWYYRHSEEKERILIICDNPEEAIDGAMSE